MSLEKIRDLVKKKAGDKIEILKEREHKKASEIYIDVVFHYDGTDWCGSVPTVYRRTGLSAETPKDAAKIILEAYDHQNPKNEEKWRKESDEFWKEKPNADITKGIFDAIVDSKWTCIQHGLPANPNWSRRNQDIKEMGFTIATNNSMHCKKCDKKTTHILLLRIPRGQSSGYETWSPQLRAKIISVLDRVDVFENAKRANVLPDHKFPEIRWDEDTREGNLDDMPDAEIKKKFQLIDNQRNEQKREVCRSCYQTGKRGIIFGIDFFYEGDEKWPEGVPKDGKDAEKGCIGCGWYDIAKWRDELNKKINSA